MDASSNPIIVSLDLQEKEETLNFCGQRRYRNGTCMVKRSRRISSSRNLLDRSRRSRNVVGKRVKTLRKLVPSTEPVGLDGLFRDTADYIMALQLRVKLMQDMVDLLAGSDE